jgi:GntR family transcriptional regulator, transcriptional repressor for pyruvate dehydrogenase complex
MARTLLQVTSLFQRCTTTRVFEGVAEQIRRAIVSGQLPPGSRLPPQRQLAETFGVGRSTLLAALRVLEESGLIVVRPGAKGGAYVTVPSIEQVSEALDLFLQRQGTTLQELAEFRQEVEGSALALAGQRATPEEIASLVTLVNQLRELNRQGEAAWPSVVSTELRLHRTLIALSHNRVSTAVMTAINATMERAFGCLPYGHGDRILADWEAIVTALAAGRIGDAQAALRQHISFFNQPLVEDSRRGGNSELSSVG